MGRPRLKNAVSNETTKVNKGVKNSANFDVTESPAKSSVAGSRRNDGVLGNQINKRQTRAAKTINSPQKMGKGKKSTAKNSSMKELQQEREDADAVEMESMPEVVANFVEEGELVDFEVSGQATEFNSGEENSIEEETEDSEPESNIDDDEELNYEDEVDDEVILSSQNDGPSTSCG